MGNQSLSIVEKVVAWCGSFAGILTILVVAVTANRMILSAIREKHSKDSTFYRNAKTISFMAYAVFFINVIGVLLSNAKNGAISIGTVVIETPWAVGMILAIIYIMALVIAASKVKVSIAWIGTVITICGTQLLTQDFDQNITDWTIGIGILTLVISTCWTGFVLDLDKQSGDTNDETEEPHKGVILTLLWIASLIAAYLAGEYSLIPKLIEYFQDRAQKMAAKAEARRQAKEEKETTDKTTEPKPAEAE